MKAKVILSLAVILVIAAALVWKTKKNEPKPETALSSTQQAGVMMTTSGFEPAELKIKNGTTVTFLNQDSKPRWPASAPHPTHTDYPEFDPKQALTSGQSWSFTFEEAGEWRYHDHLNPTVKGTITVE
ncbi:MAG: cupredoxin domain-containing protein [Candidatus Doudnabacteria bacterium]|nr:cupredoxin domain-containing protein [Candidatus Doudnabacteria bacterium]